MVGKNDDFWRQKILQRTIDVDEEEKEGSQEIERCNPDKRSSSEVLGFFLNQGSIVKLWFYLVI